MSMVLNPEQMYERILACDRTYDGQFYTGVLTTGIYCLPSCPARKPKLQNIRFFTSERQALEAGLRACKRCKPQEHGHFVDESKLSAAVDAFRRDPGKYKTVEDVADALGFGVSKLNEQVRRFYHSTPASLLGWARIDSACKRLLGTADGVAEIAFEVGYDSTSAFYESFRRFTGMAPAEYRKLPESSSFEITLPSGFSMHHWKRYVGRDAESPAEKVCGDRYFAAFTIKGAPVRMELELGSSVRCTVECISRLPDGAALAAHKRLVRMFALEADVRGFQALPCAAPLLPSGAALRIPQTATVWDGFVWSILGQQVNLRFAAALRARLIELAGTRIGDLVAPPSPEQVAVLDPDALVPLQFSRRKAEYLINAAGSGLPMEELPSWPATKLERTLLAMRGIGPWSANYLMMRACGFVDCVPLGDTGLTSALQRVLNLATRPGQEETTTLMQRFAPYRSLATYHLWNSLAEEK